MSVKYLKNKSLCPLPFAGLYIAPNGDAQCCSISREKLGNINNTSIEKIINSDTVKKIRRDMLDEKFPANCSECYKKEKNFKSLNLEDISNRLYHIGKLGSRPFKLYKDENNFDLQQLDIRWRNSCNAACVYCDEGFSNRWAAELNIKAKMTPNALEDSANYVYKNLHNLTTLYLCGGEPFLVKENLKLCQIIAETNPKLDIRINTNLSNLKNPIFEIIKKLPNIHWILSAESIKEKFEYIRWPLKWKTFENNLKIIQKLPHKISVNMSWTLLTAEHIFEFIDYMISLNVHPNAFVMNPVTSPAYFDICNLPRKYIDSIKSEAQERLGRLKDPFMLKYCYKAMIEHCNNKSVNKQEELKNELSILDKRRNVDSRKVFPKLYKEMFNE